MTDEGFNFPEHDVEWEQVKGSVIEVTPEGREGVYLADRNSLKKWIEAKNFKEIHHFTALGHMVIGADYDVPGVLEDIDKATRVAVLTGDARHRNIEHALALIIPAKGTRQESLEMYDIGEITEDDLEILPTQTEAAINATGA